MLQHLLDSQTWLGCQQHHTFALRMISHQRQIGKTLEFISEQKRTTGGFHWGISDNYLRVKLPGGTNGGKEIVRVKITAAYEDHMEGDIHRHRT